MGVHALRAILPDFLEQGLIGHRVEDRVLRSVADVAAPEEIRHDENVVFLPFESLAGDLRFAAAGDADIDSARCLALELRFLARADELRAI